MRITESKEKYHISEDWSVSQSICGEQTSYTPLTITSWKKIDVQYLPQLPYCDKCDKILSKHNPSTDAS